MAVWLRETNEKLANVDLGCLNVMASPSLFLHFSRQLVFPCSYLIRGTIPTSVLVLVKNIFYSLVSDLFMVCKLHTYSRLSATTLMVSTVGCRLATYAALTATRFGCGLAA